MDDQLDGFIFYHIIGVAVCVIISAFFSGTETALTALSNAKADELLEKYRFISGMLRKWIEKPGIILSTILIGNNLVNILGSILAGKIANHYLHNYADAVAVGGMTFVVLIVGEITPKTYAKLNPARFVIPALIFLRVFYILFYPVALVLSNFARIMVRVLGGKYSSEGVIITQSEIEYQIRKGQSLGVFETEDQGEMLESVVEFKDTIVREIMIPRTDAHFMSIDTTLDEAIDLVTEWGHSRIPVYEETVDDVQGVLYAKDTLKLLRDGAEMSQDIGGVIRKPVLFVPETQKISDTLDIMQARRTHIAVVVDEYGGTAGIITLEDILEEIVGEIMDEDDREEYRIDSVNNIVSVDAHIPIADLEDKLDIEIPEHSDYTSLGGFIIHHTGSVPSSGYSMEYGDYRFKVLESDEKHIIRVEIRKSEQREDEEDRG